MTRTTRAVAIITAFALCGLAAPARADRADQLFKKGKKLLAEKKYAEACSAFEDSDRLDPGIGAKLNIARCYEEWGKLATAWRWFSAAEDMADAARDDRAKKIHALVAELDASVPRLTVTVPRGANLERVVVQLDGVTLEPSALGVERRVDPGPHQIDTIIDGAKQTRVVPVERGARSEVAVELGKAQRSPGEPAPPAIADPTAARDRIRTRRLTGLAVSGAGGVAVVIAGIVTLRAHGDYSTAISHHCNGASDMCDAVGLRATHSARQRANIATVVTLGGLAAVGAGLALYFTAPAAPRGEHALYIAPSLTGDRAGAVFGGAF
jgi:hypothetical protein